MSAAHQDIARQRLLFEIAYEMLSGRDAGFKVTRFLSRERSSSQCSSEHGYLAVCEIAGHI